MVDGSKLRYVLVGGVCAGLHNAVMLACAQFHIHYSVSSLVSYTIVMLVGYSLHTTFTFSVPRTRSGFIRYVGATASNYPISVFLLFVLVDLAGVSLTASVPISTALLIVWNYLANRWALMGQCS